MSASRERKKRMQQANEPAPAAPKKKKKKLSEGWIFTITIVLILALVFSVLMIQLNQKRSKTVLTVGGHDVSVKEFNYFYNTTVNTLSSYASYVGIDTSVGLDKQYVTSDGAMYLGLFGIDSSYLEDKELTDGTYNVTWAQLIADAAKSSAVSTYVLYNAAMDAGFEVTEEIESEVEAGMDVMQGYADTNGESLNSLIRRVFGSGCNAKGYRQYLTVNYVAEHYGSELTYSAEEISARYNESPEDYDVATYYLYTISGSSMVETAEDGTTPEVTDEDTAKAKQAAEEMEANFNVDDENVSVRADNTRASVTSLVSEDAATWLFDEAQPGDVKMFAKEDTTFYVFKLIDKEDYQTVNIMELVIEADHEHEEGEEVDHEHDENELTAAEKLEAVETALAADSSLENFKSLIAEYSSEEDGEVKGMTRSTMSGVSPEILDWFLEDRTVGDYKVFDVNGTTLVLYFTGYGDNYSTKAVNAALVNEWAENAIAEATEACGYSEENAMLGNVSIYG